jgi:MraZ protein
MYYGEVQTAVDDKGRIMVPQQFRAVMDVFDHETWCVTRGFENYLFLFHKKSWEQFLADNAKVFQGLDTKRSMLRRMFVGGMEKLKRDGQGRLAIPAHLREYVGIDREAVLIGVGDHLELWSKSGWLAYQERQSEAYKNLADELFADSSAAAAITGVCG